MKLWRLSLLVIFVACSSSEDSPSPTSSSSSSTGASGSTSASGGSGGSATSTIATSSGGSTAGGQGGSSGAAGAGGDGRDASADGPANSGDASTEAQKVCTTFANALCTKLQSCSTFVLGVLYGDEATCEKRIALSCVPAFGAPGTSATPAKTAACGQSMASLACPTFLAGDFGAACKTDPGTLAMDGACADDAQCASAFCARAPDATCGVCQPPTTVGGPCVRSSCSSGQACPAGQSKCITPVPGKVNDACTAQEQCDLAHAVGCNTGTSKCLALTLATAQGSCGANSPIGTTSYAVCPANGTCSAPFAGKCAAAAADGAPCSIADTGAHCVSPARCVGGKCAVPDPSTCH